MKQLRSYFKFCASVSVPETELSIGSYRGKRTKVYGVESDIVHLRKNKKQQWMHVKEMKCVSSLL